MEMLEFRRTLELTKLLTVRCFFVITANRYIHYFVAEFSYKIALTISRLFNSIATGPSQERSNNLGSVSRSNSHLYCRNEYSFHRFVRYQVYYGQVIFNFISSSMNNNLVVKRTTILAILNFLQLRHYCLAVISYSFKC